MRTNKGFTLIELMTALSIFIIIMTISMSSILSVFDANRKSRSLKTVLNNLNLAIEGMSKEMRFGKNYHCGSGIVTSQQNCPSGDTLMSFLSSSGIQTTYRFNAGAIEKQIGDGEYIALTAPEIIIDDLVFYTLGAGTGDTLQPKVFIKIKSHAGSGKNQSNFTLQTLVSQRLPDILVISTAVFVSSSPNPVTPGGGATATWGNISNPTTNTWIGLYDVNADNFTRVDNLWFYVNSCTKTADTDLVSAGTCSYTIPAIIPLGGTYELRLFPDNPQFNKLATSPSFTVN